MAKGKNTKLSRKPGLVKSKAAAKATRDNPFERIRHRKKHAIVGQKLKGQETALGQARRRDLERRKDTLLVEMHADAKHNVFMDRRVGEENESLSREDKMLARFQRERQRKLRKAALYQLDGDEGGEGAGEGDEGTLTHLGAPISLLSDFSDLAGDEEDPDDEDARAFNKSMVNMHFGGGIFERVAEERDLDAIAEVGQVLGAKKAGRGDGDEPGGERRSHRDIMAEVIQRSKAFRELKAVKKEAQLELGEDLDREFGELRAQLQLRPTGAEALRSRDAEQAPVAQGGGLSGALPVPDAKSAADFDDLVAELGMEGRREATDRYKTPQEKAAQEKQLLERLERERLRRMQPDMFVDEAGEEADREEAQQRAKQQRERRRGIGQELGGDSLEPAYAVVSDDDGQEVYASDGDEEQPQPRLRDTVEVVDARGRTVRRKRRERAREDAGSASQLVRRLRDQTGEEAASRRSELERSLPYTFELPSSSQELEELLAGRSLEECALVLSRVRTCHHVSLRPENAERLRPYAQLLVQRLVRVVDARHDEPLDQAEVLTTALWQLSADAPAVVADALRAHFLQLDTRVADALMESRAPRPLSLGEVCSLQLVTKLYPVTDFQHPVTTPAQLLLGELLTFAEVRSPRDAVSSLLTCALFYRFVAPTARYAPEPMRYLTSVLRALAGAPESEPERPSGTLRLGGFSTKVLRQLRRSALSATALQRQRQGAADQADADEPAPDEVDQKEKEEDEKEEEEDDDQVDRSAEPLPEADQMMDMDGAQEGLRSLLSEDLSKQSFVSKRFRQRLLNAALRLLRTFADLYGDLDSFPSLMAPSLAALNALESTRLWCGAAERLNTHLQRMAARRERERQPLTWQKRKPIPLRMLRPAFKEDYIVGQDLDPNRERVEQKRLRRQVKHEMKGAARELRKDARFVQRTRIQQQEEEETERAAKLKTIIHDLQVQEHDYQQFTKAKLKTKRKRTGATWVN